MTLTLEPATEAKLLEVAQREGQDISLLADALLADSLAERERQFAENVQAIQEGLDAVDAGRVRPFEEFLSEHRQRYPDAEPAL